MQAKVKSLYRVHKRATGLRRQAWIGAPYCDVDLTEQHARYYDATGNLLWESGIVSGKPGGEDATPTGTYYLKTHQSPSMLRGPEERGRQSTQ